VDADVRVSREDRTEPTNRDDAVASGFDRVARIYRWIEYLAFGRTLQRARTAHLAALRSCRDILLVGDGDGRCLEAVLREVPAARVTTVDGSSSMLDHARRRAERAGATSRVEFVRADLRTATWLDGRYDAVVTLFVLDCFRVAQVEAIVGILAAALRPHGLWLFADFDVPPRGWRRWHARTWVGLLYAFFRATTGLGAQSLPPSESLIHARGFDAVAVRTYRAGLIRSVRFARS
jgi:ubiquinone/menaquinone biosynthesis C-methylase UbiE